MNTTEQIHNAFVSLDGKVFNDREDLEDAIYPFFGPLQSYFTGEGHRDMVDRLINAGWVTFNKQNSKYTVELPVVTPIDRQPLNPIRSSSTTHAEDPKIQLSYEELQVLLDVSANISGKMLSVKDHMLNRLIAASLVELVDATSSREKESSQVTERRFVMIRQAIEDKDYYLAISHLEIAAKNADTLRKNDLIYRLTPKGEDVRSNLMKATVSL